MSKTVAVTWLQSLQFVGTDSSKHSVVLSGQSEADGVGMKPAELLLVSLAGCTAYDVVNILRKKRKKLLHVRVSAEGSYSDKPPYPIVRIHLHYVVSGYDLSERDVAKAIQLSREKYCSISATLEPGVEITSDYEVIPPEELNK